MSETEPIIPIEKCFNCPNRGRISRLLVRLVAKERLASQCEGPVSVARGVIETQLRYKGELAPEKSEFNWNRVTGPAWDSDDPRRYSKTSWTTEDVCGREDVGAREGEVPYSLSGASWTNEDGSRHAAFTTGDKEQISEHRRMQGIIALLDSTSRLQAKDATEDEKADAINKMAEMGFTLEVSAGRDTPTDKNQAV